MHFIWSETSHFSLMCVFNPKGNKAAEASGYLNVYNKQPEENASS